ncbi:dehydroquinate synthase/iron-containing alcohol dehydrogenase family protein [Desulfotruncus alcoholivorax]|uniref:iron-containing alcohol dehydrogenase n=1 Tax=Desulfotruncus alcoholivorax TaxID=265477 RepID=UPI00040B4B93|nr:iron-containing alcohol dehydrogenase [Desulfotruncus alcoholivorax]
MEENTDLLALLDGPHIYQSKAPEGLNKYITLFELTNFDSAWADGTAFIAEVHLQVDVWVKEASTSPIAAEVDKTMKFLGLNKMLILESFIREFRSRPADTKEFDEQLWAVAVDIVMVMPDNRLIFRFKDGTGGFQAPSCHAMEHELSAFYDITHGLGLAILTPRWMKYILDESTAPQFKKFGVNIFGVDESLSDMEGAEHAIACLSDFLFKTLGLQSTLTEIGIDDENFKVMAKKACWGDVLQGFKPLTPQDVENIYRMCL